MISIDAYAETLPRILLFSDLYRDILDVPGNIFHIGSSLALDAHDLILWQSLRELYETTDTRRICVLLDDKESQDSLSDRLMTYLDTEPCIAALVYFDHCDRVETEECLNQVIPRLTRGSVIAFSIQNLEQITAIINVIGLGGIRLQAWHPTRKDCYMII
jgi:hypothetical protein